MKLKELVRFLDGAMELERFSGDHANNGLQYEGKAEVARVAFAVDACRDSFQAAAEWGAELLFVHHGLSWGAEPRRFTGMTAERLNLLCRSQMSLYAVHLPLDAHPQLGNNARLARMANLENLTPCCFYDGVEIGFAGDLPETMTIRQLTKLYEAELGSTALYAAPAGRKLSKVVVVSGGGGLEALNSAAAAEADVLVTGEFNHTMYHCAREQNLAVIALGHYASETLGVKAVMDLLEKKFSLDCRFIDLPTGL